MKNSRKLLCLVAIGSLMIGRSAYSEPAEFINKINFQPQKNNSVLVLEYDGSAQATVKEDTRIRQIVIEIPGAQLPANLTRIIDLAAHESPVVQITPYNSASPEVSAKIVLQLREQVDFTKDQAPGKFTLKLAPLGTVSKFYSDVDKDKKDLEKETDHLPALGAFKHNSETLNHHEVKRIELAKAWIETDAIHSSSSATDKVDRSAEIAKQLEETLNSTDSDKEYHGSKVNFEATDADVHDIFKLVSATSGLNILTATDVTGKVNISLKDVPWDHLLEVILQEANLRMAVTGNIVRIMTAMSYNRELDDRKKAMALNHALEPTIMAILPISYAKVDEMKKMIETLLIKPAVAGNAEIKDTEQSFERGKIEIDQRSNSLIVTNTGKAIERIKRLLKELDVPMPQILIESKIVIASEDFANSLGVSWGAIGNPAGGQAGAGFSFNGGSGGASSSSSSSGSAATFTVPTASKGAGTLGFALGGTSRVNLGAQLSLGEQSNLSKTVASPKLIVGNKQSASINDTQNAVYTTQSTSTGGVATEKKFVSLPLTMTVTPQITNAGSVLMDLNVSKSSLTDPSTGASTSKSLNTQVLVDSGSTLVLGGVYQYQTNHQRDGLPFLKDLPILGFLFRNESQNENKSELLVFVTPKILDTGATGISNSM